jgi:hypothetical protein
MAKYSEQTDNKLLLDSVLISCAVRDRYTVSIYRNTINFTFQLPIIPFNNRSQVRNS